MPQHLDRQLELRNQYLVELGFQLRVQAQIVDSDLVEGRLMDRGGRSGHVGGVLAHREAVAVQRVRASVHPGQPGDTHDGDRQHGQHQRPHREEELSSHSRAQP